MPREKKDGIKVSYILERPLIEELTEFCDKTGRTKTKVIEMSIRDYLKKHESELTE